MPALSAGAGSQPQEPRRRAQVPVSALGLASAQGSCLGPGARACMTASETVTTRNNSYKAPVLGWGATVDRRTHSRAEMWV